MSWSWHVAPQRNKSLHTKSSGQLQCHTLRTAAVYLVQFNYPQANNVKACSQLSRCSREYEADLPDALVCDARLVSDSCTYMCSACWSCEMLSESWHHVLVARLLQHAAALHMKHAQAFMRTFKMTQAQHHTREEAHSQQKTFFKRGIG